VVRRSSYAHGGKVFSHLGMTGEWVHIGMGAPVVRFERARA